MGLLRSNRVWRFLADRLHRAVIGPIEARAERRRLEREEHHLARAFRRGGIGILLGDDFPALQRAERRRRSLP